jgi:methyl-accepting chemotaxis protein
MRQLQGELRQRVQDAQELRRMLDRNSAEAQDVDRVIQELMRMSNDRRYDDPAGIERLRQAIDLLHQVELELGGALAQLIQNNKYYYADDSEVPAAYRKLVEEYYKALARIKR